MRAAVLETIPGALTISDVQIDAPGPREVLIRTVAAGCCHSDLHYLEGKFTHETPTVLGHEGAGVVERVGEGVESLVVGDHVVTCLSVFCGQCRACVSGRTYMCTKVGTRRPADAPPRLSRDGAPMAQYYDLSSFAEQMLVHEGAVVRIREDMPLDCAALLGCGVTTGLGAVFNTARVRPGETVAVIGCGGVGLAAIQGAVLAGAGRVIAVDRQPAKLLLAESFGATDLVNASDGNPIGQVKELTGGGVDHAFEAIGLKETAEQAFSMLGPSATATLIGMIPPGTKLELTGFSFLSDKKFQGSVMGSNHFRIDIPRYVDMYLAGKLQLDPLISERITLDEVNGAFEQMKTGEVARSVIVF